MMWLTSRQAKLVCIPSSWLMSSFENVKPCFLSQKIDVKDLEKKFPQWQLKLPSAQQRLTSGWRSNACPSHSVQGSRHLDVYINEKGVSFGVDVLHHDLEATEAVSFSSMNLIGETFDSVLIDNAVGCGEEGEDMRDEVVFIVVELVCPVMEVL